MEPIDDESRRIVKILGYAVEFHADKFRGFGFALLVGEGIYYRSARFELTIPFFTCGFHVIKREDNEHHHL